MGQKQIKMIMLGLILVAVFALVFPWAVKVYYQSESARLFVQERVDFREKIQDDHIRRLEQKVWELEAKIFHMGIPAPSAGPNE